VSTGCIGNYNTAAGVYIYGNVFVHTTSYTAQSYNGVIFNNSSATSATGYRIYNNSFVNLKNKTVINLFDSTVSDNIAYNNIFYNTTHGGVAAVPTRIGLTTSAYNWYYPAIAHGENFSVNGTGNPFVSWTTGDFSLTTATVAGYSLASPYNTDPYAVTRGGDGTWDRGAYEITVGEDTTAPVTSNGLPSGVQACTATPTELTLSMVTNENALCRWSTADVVYGSMTPFTTTGAKTHQEPISKACSAPYTYYARCQDLSANANTNLTSTTISFSVAAGAGDVTAPVMSGAIPTTGTYHACTTNPRDIPLQVTATDATTPITCKYGTTSGQAYDDMPGTYGTVDGNNHSQTVSLACGSDYTYHSRCADSVGTPNKSSSSLSTTFYIVGWTPLNVIEAESVAEVSPMVEGLDVTAGGGKYISSPTDLSGTATYTVAVATTGTYRIGARVYATGPGNDSMFLQVDSEDEVIWDFNPTVSATYYNVWYSDYVTKRGTGTFDAPQYDPYTVALSAGNHTFVFRGREDGARLDYFYLELVDVPPQPPAGSGATHRILGTGNTVYIGSGNTIIIE
jgi:hypothetical protein